MLFQNFEKSCPRDVGHFSSLELLERAPILAPSEASDRDLTLRMVFLLVLTSVKTVGELQALVVEVDHSKGWRSLSFSFIQRL